MPQSQTAASPRHKEEEKKDKTYMHKTNKQMDEKHKDQPPLPQARWSECLDKRRNEDKEHEKTLKHQAPRGINHKATKN